MVYCETPDFIYPMQADVFYPIVEQGAYGDVKKLWVLDKTIIGNFAFSGSALKEEVKPNVNITQQSLVLARVKTDIRVSSRDVNNSITNILITNIRDKSGNYIYNETSGPRAGKSTIFEIATVEPFVGPFGGVEYYKLVIRRAENQAANV
jgi:hypothetical protein